MYHGYLQYVSWCTNVVNVYACYVTVGYMLLLPSNGIYVRYYWCEI